MGADAAHGPTASPPDPTRRLLMAATATALAAPFLAPLTFAAGEAAAPATPAEPTDLEARAEALLGYLVVHFAPHLSAASSLQDVRRDLTGLLRAAEALRTVDLANHEEPDFLFAAVPPR